MRHTCFLAAITSGTELTSFKEVVKDLGWRKVMQDKINALERNRLWAIRKFKQQLNERFHMKDLGILKYFLGIKVKDGLFLLQRKYVICIINEASFLGARPISTPMEQNCLIYLTITQPKLCYFVHILAQIMGDPRVEHWDATLRVL
uniref:Reverse transcriptase Ty1/copia-type domain-containing protein n=1 Tax=Cajanus cajan TaxID=3821 RepID=A0A151TKS5_CAJCA|nr:hypothetical protein KK1_023993 [Cajanus cajan]